MNLNRAVIELADQFPTTEDEIVDMYRVINTAIPDRLERLAYAAALATLGCGMTGVGRALHEGNALCHRDMTMRLAQAPDLLDSCRRVVQEWA
jgi:hypothetical protein